MAFGRSNSLSLNTGATNSLFTQQQNNTSQPQQSGSLFGSSQPQQSGGLFGNTNAAKPAGGLFGSTASQPQQQQQQQSGGLFGSTATTSQPQQSGGLFGNTNNTTNQQSGSSSLFGSNTTSTGGGLFGASTQQSQPQQNGGLFGGTLGQNQNQNQNQGQQNQGGGLFGGLGQNQNQTQPQQSGGLFGGLSQNKPASSSLFGASTAQQQPQQQAPQQGSLFGTSIFNNSTSNAPLAGSLTMGQQNQQQPAPGVKVDVSQVRPTTRFNDLHDDIKRGLEEIDSFIKKQESFAAQCEAMIPNHSRDVESVTPDVELISSKVETVELSLENDSREISAAKQLNSADITDFSRCVRIIENLTLPSNYHYGPSAGGARSRVGDDDYDVDLVGYFSRQADAMQKTLETFTSNITEIENHLRVIESTTIQQAQQVVAQRAGGAASNDTVRELADTLRGFENGILDAAGFVGACREGVNELILGRVGGEARNGSVYRRY